MKRRLQTPLAVLVLALGVGFAGCGGDDGDDEGTTEASAELARYAPADALAFGQAAVRPEGDLKDSIESILDRFPRGDSVGQQLIDDINQDLAEDGLSYEDNFEPWLGQAVGGFITGLRFEGGEPNVSRDEAAILFESTDDARAEDELVAASEKDGRVQTETYKGVEIHDQVTGEDPGTVAVYEGVAILGGGPAAVREAIDAATGTSLSANPELSEFLAERQGDNMAVGYADVAALFDVLERSGALPKEQLESIRKTYGASVDQPFLAALDVQSDKVSLDFAAGASEGGISPEESSLVQSLPGEAWVVFGLGDIGRYVEQFTDQLAAVGQSQGFSGQQLDRILQREAGFTLDDLTVLGDAAFFASGESILELQVGGVFEAAPGPERDRLMGALERGVRRSGEARIEPLEISGAEGFAARPSDFPAPINFATEGDKLVIAVGENATQTLLEGDGGSEAVDRGRDALGGDDFAVTFALQMDPVLDLVENSGGEDDPEFVEARKYLEQFSTIAAGSETEGDQTLFRIVAELSD